MNIWNSYIWTVEWRNKCKEVFSFKMARILIFSPRTPAKVRSNLKLRVCHAEDWISIFVNFWSPFQVVVKMQGSQYCPLKRKTTRKDKRVTVTRWNLSQKCLDNQIVPCIWPEYTTIYIWTSHLEQARGTKNCLRKSEFKVVNGALLGNSNKGKQVSVEDSGDLTSPGYRYQVYFFYLLKKL